jgi:hypothetical protein
VDPIRKITKARRAGGMAEVVECLPSKCKSLSFNPGTTKKKKSYMSKMVRKFFLLTFLVLGILV